MVIYCFVWSSFVNLGRILNRFSKDVGTMDDQLSFVFFDMVAVRVHLSLSS